MVDAAEFRSAIDEHRAALAERYRLTRDYRNHVLYGELGTTIYTDFGGYRVYEDFHRSWNSSVPPMGWRRRLVDRQPLLGQTDTAPRQTRVPPVL
jgi:hypothetical protein